MTEIATDVPRYGRWTRQFDSRAGVDAVELVGPDETVDRRLTFLHQPAKLRYDDHGYETVEPDGEVVAAVRFTPTSVGRHRFVARSGESIVEEGTFDCLPSGHPGFVQVSRRDPRYFAFSDGTSYCAIGLNLCGPARYSLPRGGEHFATSGRSATLGAAEYERWFRLMAENGANFARLWLSNGFFEAQTEVAGEMNLAAFARVDAVIELARRYGIRLKLCLENFRSFDPAKSSQATTLRHPDGDIADSMDEWFLQDRWQHLWWGRVDAYMARYGDDPTVMAWELWNEINCCVTSDWSVQRDWTRRTLPEIKRRAPRNLAVNSIGSFDTESFQSWYDDFMMDEMDFQQVHRYLDQGAPWEICRHDPAAFSWNAIQRTRRSDRPVILAETGAVNDQHTGSFRYCRMDNRGIVFHDTTYPAFFAGAAGTGHIWHWDSYVDQKNLWWQFKPFAEMVAGIALDEERCHPVNLSNERVWFLALKGSRHVLCWVRNRADSWHAVLRDGKEPSPLRNHIIDLSKLGVRTGDITTSWPWRDGRGRATLSEGALRLPAFRYGLLLKVRL
jgi:hypothetical protein